MLNTQEPQPTSTFLPKEGPTIMCQTGGPADDGPNQDWGANTPHQDEHAERTVTAKDSPGAGPSSDGVVQYNDFEDMGLPDQLLRGIYAFGFERPSVIQQKAIVPAASGRDVVMHAQSGTGKTGAFGIGMLARIQPNAGQTQALILSPTRDLADQTHRVRFCLSPPPCVNVGLPTRTSLLTMFHCRSFPHLVTTSARLSTARLVAAPDGATPTRSGEDQTW